MVGTTSFVGQPDDRFEALDSQLKFTASGTGDWYTSSGEDDEYYYEADAAQSDYNLPDSNETCLQAIVDSDSSQTVKWRQPSPSGFYWKVSSEQNHDYLQSFDFAQWAWPSLAGDGEPVEPFYIDLVGAKAAP